MAGCQIIVTFSLAKPRLASRSSDASHRHGVPASQDACHDEGREGDRLLTLQCPDGPEVSANGGDPASPLRVDAGRLHISPSMRTAADERRGMIEPVPRMSLHARPHAA
jgi:hypothetical protein